MEQSNSQTSKKRWLTISLWIGIPVFLFCTTGVDMLGWMKNHLCNPYFGCDSGFFGYDALMHFLGGGLIVFIYLWLMYSFPHLNLFGNNPWKNFLVLIALVMFSEVIWEMVEFTYDHVRVIMLHMSIPTPELAQPSNSDTMGDLTFSFLGGLITAMISRIFDKSIF